MAQWYCSLKVRLTFHEPPQEISFVLEDLVGLFSDSTSFAGQFSSIQFPNGDDLTNVGYRFETQELPPPDVMFTRQIEARPVLDGDTGSFIMLTEGVKRMMVDRVGLFGVVRFLLYPA